MRVNALELLVTTCLLSPIEAKPDKSPNTNVYCPPTGRVLPAPVVPSDLVKKTPLKNTLEKLLKDSDSPFDTAETSFSVTVTSSDETLFEFHHAADKLSKEGAQRVDGNTVYRIASVTKVFTTLSAMLQDGLDFDDYAWQHVPELRGLENYKEITVKMLASHVSGIVRDGYAFDLTANTPPNVLQSFGLPNVTAPDDFQRCDSLDTGLCTREEFFKSVKQGAKTWLPGVTASYSNYAFILLGLVAEGYTGKPLREIIKESITDPLKLTSSGLYIPDAKKIVTPPGYEQLATVDMGYWKPTAGMFATPKELGQFARGILNHKLLSRTKTDTWFKPSAFTATGSGAAVGMPWSVLRTENIKRPSGDRPLEVYTMIGSFAVYGAYIAFIPEYNVAFTVNIAGTGNDIALRTLLGHAIEKTIPALDETARKQAKQTFAGNYKGSDGNSITLSVDNGPGIKIEKWTTGGKSVFDAWLGLSEDGVGADSVEARIYPRGPEDKTWQVGFQAYGIPETSLFQGYCQTWFNFDKFRYAGLSVDEVTFKLGKNGKIQGVEVPGLRAKMSKA